MTARPLFQTDPLAGYRAHKRPIDRAVLTVLGRGAYILATEVAAFEREFAAYIGSAGAVGVGSGTDALIVALRACGIGRGDAVLTVSFTAVATVAAIEAVGATPVFIDIDPETYVMSPESLRLACSAWRGRRPRPKAVVPVHLYGHPAPMNDIVAIARRYGLVVIEDCAQSHGARLAGRMTGRWGDMAAFSFYPTKNLGAFGDGGAVVAASRALREKALIIRQYGWKKRYISAIPGINTRLDELQAAILRVKLRHLDGENRRRRSIASLYDAGLPPSITKPVSRPGAEHVYHQYVVRVRCREPFRRFLAAKGIGTAIHYPQPVHLQPAYRGRIVCASGALPATEAVSRGILSLPMHPALTSADVGRVLAASRAYVDALSGRR